ncbi:MAG: hypothetical protein IT449_08955 [Phycisphaerales bacterium]|nr:hypothetical protein [Phycisphaerales bacterium]
MRTAAKFSRSSRGGRRIDGWVLLALGLAAVLGLLRGLILVRDFAEPTELMHTTSVPVHVAREVQHHRPIYRTFDAPPYVLSLYGPLLYALPGMLARWAEPGATGLFMLGRGVSLVAFALALATAAGLMRRWGKADRATTALPVLMVFASPVAWPICMEVRADACELLLSLLGLATFLRFEASRRRLLSLPFFLGAFLFKQSALLGPVSVVVCLLMKRRMAAAAGYAALSAAVLGACVGLANAATNGAYALNCFTGLKAHLTLSNLWRVWNADTLLSAMGLLAPAAMRAWRRGRRLDAVTTYAVAGFAWACVGVLRDGSGVNYFLPPLVAASIAGGREFALRNRRFRRGAGFIHGGAGATPCEQRTPDLAVVSAVDGGSLPTGRGSAPSDALPDGRGSVGGPFPNGRGSVRRDALPCRRGSDGRGSDGRGSDGRGSERLAAALMRLMVTASLLALLVRQAPQAPSLIERALTRHGGHGQREFMLTTLGRKLNALDAPVFSEDGTLNLYLDRPVMLDSLTFSGLADVGVFDDGPLVEMIRTDRVAAFVLRFPLEGETPRYQSTARVRKEWIEAMRERKYVPLRRGWLYVYVRPDLLPEFDPPPPQ